MKIIGLDCATKTGYCLMDNGDVVFSGVEDFSKKRGESNGVMFMKFSSWLRKLLQDTNPDLVTYEQSHHRGGASTEIGVNLTGRVQEMCAEAGFQYMPVHTATLKKFATGNGRADKADMIKAAKEILGCDPRDDNEADAVMLASYGHGKIN